MGDTLLLPLGNTDSEHASGNVMPPLSTRLIYGAGGAVYAVKEAAYTMFILLFYTQVLGLNGTLTGLIVALSLIWDAVSDPLVGTLSDRLRSKHGRRHPYMALSIVPLGLGFIGLFSPPDALLGSDALLAAWLLFWSLWVRTFVTTFSIPHLALSAEITNDYQGRSQILGARLAYMFLFSVLIPAVALTLIFQSSGGDDGRFVQGNYPIYGAFSCAVCWLLASITTFGTRRYARPSHTQPIPPPRHAGNTLTQDLLRTLGNRSFRYLIGFELSVMASFGAISALNMLVWTYYWEFDAKEVSIILSLPSLLAVALVMLSLRPLGRHLEKYQLLQLSTVGLILNCLWLYPLHILGLLPDNGELWFALNLVFMLIFMYCFLMRGIQAQSIIADLSDEHEWDHGMRQEAGFFAASNFAQKFATVFGPLYGGLALDLIGLESGMLPGSLDDSILDGLVIAFGLGSLPGMLLALLFSTRITISRARVADLQRMLGERAAASPP
ncbi:MAG: GPH family glycoside/pentoside/hexuronide:cation symporter [Glaciecola sp.]|jgi:GPH family glycoside/pentoside/hexuronide:cation symporter|uniref:MFS transporter n=1 Tax=Congregibacter sp. TaxID=2744308 RepID=UPI0039E29B44